MRMGDEGAQVRVAAIPTGALSLDLALGIGGVPRGRIVEVSMLGPAAITTALSSPPFRSSKRITSAPSCAKVIPAIGAAMKAEPSITRRPATASGLRASQAR